MTEPPAQAPSPADIADMVRQLDALPDQQFAEALADCVMDPEPTEQAAFRSEPLVFRSLAATRYLIDHVNTSLRRRADESNKAWQVRAEHFRNRVGMERRLLEAVANGMRARDGRLPNAPNPRQRAMRRLAQQYPQEFLRLVREEQDADKARRRAAKDARKRERAQQRAQHA